MANLGKIRELCDSRKISLKELAEKIGLTQGGIQYIFRENNTKVDTLENIARVLEVPVSTFFDDGTPDDLIIRLKDMTRQLYAYEQSLKSSESRFQDQLFLNDLYTDLIELVDKKILPLIKIDALKTDEINHIIEYDRIRGTIFDIEEEEQSTGLENDDQKMYKPFYITFLNKLIEDQKKKIDELKKDKKND